MHDETRAALERLQTALGVSGTRGADPIEALEALAETAEPIAKRTFDGDPYAALVLALAPAPAELEVATRVSDLVAFDTSWWPQVGFYVDRRTAPDGRHRVYIRDEAALPGQPWRSLPSIAALAEGWAKAARGDTEVEWIELDDDPWEAGPTSGAFVLETMMRASLAAQWALAGIGAYLPQRPELADEPLPVGADASGRELCLHALRVLRLAGAFELPEAMPELSEEQQAYIAHLRDLEGAFAGREPSLVAAVAAEPGPLRKEAKTWLAGFRDAAQPAELLPVIDAPLDEPERKPLTTFEKKLRAGVEAVVQRLVDAGDLELLHREMLIDELTRVAAEARGPKHLLKKLVRATVDSEAVEELYVSDDALHDAFRKGLGFV